MDDKQYRRLVQTSVTCFLHCGNEYLFLKRNRFKRVDPGRLNGIGGRLEQGENYLDAAIRETEEETGYKVTRDDVTFCGIFKLQGGYPEDWVMGFFKVAVPTKHIPKGSHSDEDGELVWLHKDKILSSEYELVDDLNYCIPDVIAGKEIFFATAQLDDNQKITVAAISKLPR